MTLNYLNETFDNKLSRAFGPDEALPDEDKFSKHILLWLTPEEKIRALELIGQTADASWHQYVDILLGAAARQNIDIQKVTPDLYARYRFGAVANAVRAQPILEGIKFDPDEALPDEDKFEEEMFLCDGCEQEYYASELENCLCGSNYCRKCAGIFDEIRWDGAGIETCPHCTGQNPLEHIGEENIEFDPDEALPDEDEFKNDDCEHWCSGCGKEFSGHYLQDIYVPCEYCNNTWCENCLETHEFEWDNRPGYEGMMTRCPACRQQPNIQAEDISDFDLPADEALPDEDKWEDPEEEEEYLRSSLITMIILAPGSQEEAVEFGDGIMDMYKEDVWGDNYELVGYDSLMIYRGYGDQMGLAAFIAARMFNVPGYVKLGANFYVGDGDMSEEQIRASIAPMPVRIGGAVIIPNVNAWMRLPEVREEVAAFQRDVESWEAGGERPHDIS